MSKRNEIALTLGLAFIAAVEYATSSHLFGENKVVDQTPNDVKEDEQPVKKTRSKAKAKVEEAAVEEAAVEEAAVEEAAVEEAAVEEAEKSEITISTIEAAIADARSNNTPAEIRKVIKAISGVASVNDIDEKHYAEVIEALRELKNKPSVEDEEEDEVTEHPDEKHRPKMEKLLKEVSDEFGTDEAKSIISEVGEADKMKNIDPSKIKAVIAECEKTLDEI